MSAHFDALANRRAALVAESDQNRAAVAESFGAIERRLAVAELVVATARRIHRHRAVIGAVAAWLIIAPRSARSWIGRASALMPFVIEGVRLFRSRQQDRTDSSSAD